MQKISPIHLFTVAIQQILESHDLKVATPLFDHAKPTITYQLLAITIKKNQLVPLVPL